MLMMNHHSKSNAKRFETGKTGDIVGVCRPSGISAGQNVKEFPSAQKRGGERAPSKQVNIATDSFRLRTFRALREKPYILKICF